MKILAIDSSSRTATAAIVDDDGIIGEYSVNYRKSSVILMPMIDDLLKMTGINKKEITHLAVSKGPGSFTGLRIGAATAKGLAHALKIPIAGVSSLDGLAYNIREFKGIICPVIDALKGYVYTAFYSSGYELKRLSDTLLIPVKELCEIIKNYGNDVIFTGDGVNVYRNELLSMTGINIFFASPVDNISRASSIGMLSIEKIIKGDLSTYIDFKPYYIRKPAAECNMKSLMKYAEGQK